MAAPALPQSITELLLCRVAESPRRAACFRRHGPSHWVPITWAELAQKVDSLAASFQTLGLRSGDTLAILAPTCLEWQLVELAALRLGAVVVGIEPHAPLEQAQYVLHHAQAQALVAYDAATAQRLPPSLLGRLRFVACMCGDELPGAQSWEQLLGTPADRLNGLPHPTPDQLATIIYTSGTTGRPKGIPFQHRHLVAACQAIVGTFPQLGPGDSVLAWLPMAHLFQRMINLVAIERGASIYFLENPRDIMACLGEVRPTVLVAVPHFYQRLHEAIETRLSTLPKPLAALARYAIAQGACRAHLARRGQRPSRWFQCRHALADALVLRRLRGLLGGRTRLLLTGSAATPSHILQFFHALGLVILEAYGVSENAIPMAANRPDAFRFGSVGKPLPQNEIRLAPDGEILVRSPGLFPGYLHQPNPQNLFTPDGFYRTGDLGRFDPDGFLYLEGRKAEIIKTSTGRRISPARVEAVYAQSPLIDQIAALGEGRKHLVGLVVPRFAALRQALVTQNLPAPENPEELARSPHARALLAAELCRLGQQLAPYERILEFALLPQPFRLQCGEITPTFKLRRQQIARNYAHLIQDLYHQPLAPSAL